MPNLKVLLLLSQIIASLAIVYVTFWIALPRLCSDWVYSAYFPRQNVNSKAMLARALAVNDGRLNEARTFLSQYKQQQLAQASGPSVVISIVTVRREEADDSDVSMSLPDSECGSCPCVRCRYSEMQGTYFANTKLLLCNTHLPPHQHTEALHMRRFAHSYIQYDDKILLGAKFDRRNSRHVFEKEKNDYVFCLEAATELSPDYVIMLQDDALLGTHFFTVLRQSIGHVTGGERRHPSGQNYVLKLFYPDKWNGYSTEISSIVELTGIALVGGCTALAIIPTSYCLLQLLVGSSNARQKRNYGWYRTITSAYVFIFGAIYLTAIAYMIGRPYVLSLWRLSPYLYHVLPSRDCCIPAVLYPLTVARRLNHFLSNVTCDADLPLDLAIDQFASASYIDKFTVEPNLVQHIGLLSSLKITGQYAAEHIY
jgi:hypothetical protein